MDSNNLSHLIHWVTGHLDMVLSTSPVALFFHIWANGIEQNDARGLSESHRQYLKHAPALELILFLLGVLGVITLIHEET